MRLIFNLPLVVLIAGLNSNLVFASNCTTDGLLCEGDVTYAYYQGRVHSGKISEIKSDEKIGFTPDDHSKVFRGGLNRESIASVHPGVCCES